MSLRSSDGSDERFSIYVEGLASVIGHADRVNPLRDYCTGLMMPCARKSVEPMAAVTAPARTAAQHQSLLHFVGQASWSDEKVLAKVYETVRPAMERDGPIEAWIIDDTGFPKKGKHSVGVARQYCGQLGKQDNCQAAVSLSIANRQASLPVRYRLYLPQEWADDAVRRRKAHVPEEIVFKTKPEIALEQVRWACAAGLPRGVVLLDAGYGNHTNLRTQISALALTYVAGILSSTSVWAPATKPLPPNNGFMLPLPSAFLLPKRYTYFVDFEFVAIRFYFNDKVSVVGSPLKRSAEFSKGDMGVNAAQQRLGVRESLRFNGLSGQKRIWLRATNGLTVLDCRARLTHGDCDS
jgi:SRSO17 transposase